MFRYISTSIESHVEMECITAVSWVRDICLIIETISILVDRIVILVKIAVGDQVVPKPTTPG